MVETKHSSRIIALNLRINPPAKVALPAVLAFTFVLLWIQKSCKSLLCIPLVLIIKIAVTLSVDRVPIGLVPAANRRRLKCVTGHCYRALVKRSSGCLTIHLDKRLTKRQMHHIPQERTKNNGVQRSTYPTSVLLSAI